MTALVVKKLGYSINPWRIVRDPCPAGPEHRTAGRCLVCEVYAPEVLDHPTLGRIVVDGPLSYPRKRDAVAALCKLDQHQEV